MKRIVDGLRYDTETAQKLAEDRHGRPGDARHVKEVLYRTSSGRFFLVGKGGPLSRYRKQVATNEWTGGRQLRPMSENEAQRWLEKRNETEVLEDFFDIQPA